jgi:hypothetical protein
LKKKKSTAWALSSSCSHDCPVLYFPKDLLNDEADAAANAGQPAGAAAPRPADKVRGAARKAATPAISVRPTCNFDPRTDPGYRRRPRQRRRRRRHPSNPLPLRSRPARRPGRPQRPERRRRPRLPRPRRWVLYDGALTHWPSRSIGAAFTHLGHRVHTRDRSAASSALNALACRSPPWPMSRRRRPLARSASVCAASRFEIPSATPTTPPPLACGL